MNRMLISLRRNRALLITLAVLAFLLLLAIQGMETEDWLITLLRSLSVAAVTFLVASGFSLIFGLLDVLNLAHGSLYMIGAYIAWTVSVRPDTFIDLLPPFLLLIAGFTLLPLWDFLARKIASRPLLARIWPWVGLLLAGFLLFAVLPHYPVTIWNPAVYTESPGTYSLFAEGGARVIPAPKLFESASPWVVLGGIFLASLFASFSLAGLKNRREAAQAGRKLVLPWSYIAAFAAVVILAILAFAFNTPLTTAVVGLGATWLFFIAIAIALLFGLGLGSLIESALIRPLYSRPIYQLMITLGLSSVAVELVRAIWGRPEFTMPKPQIFNGSGEGCPATSLADVFQHQCSTIVLFGSRIRVYNEIFIPLVGILVLVGIWLLLRQTRIGMIIRAGVQDREMVEALGINVRRVFTFVFALGVGLAALGGALAGPSTGLSSAMGDTMTLNALIAMAIGGLTSYPGAAIGSLLVGLMQQFIIKYGQIGINLPFLAEPFKPSPPLVPASTVLLMVIILLVLPGGLLGRKE